MFAATLTARTERHAREHNGRAWLAHTTAVLGRVKKFPKLTDLLSGAPAKKAGPAPWQDMLATAMKWDAAVRR